MAEQKLETATRIVKTLKKSGYQAVLAGGCVRDRLMGREPKDYDIATSATPDKVQALFPRTEAVGAAFGVVLVQEEGASFEVATFRTDVSYQDGRHPESVRFSTLEEDAQRRDFTVNGMFMDPETNEIKDLVGGQADLKAGIIRCIGAPQERFQEDKLRVLRAVRFASELDFRLEEKTLAAVKFFAPQVKDVAWERIAIEMGRLLQCAQRRKGLEWMDETGLLDVLLPEISPMKGCPQPPEFHPEGDVWVHTLLTMEKLNNPGLELAWAAFLHDIGKPGTKTQEPGDRLRFNRHDSLGAEMANTICARFKLSNASSERIVRLVADHLRINFAMEMRVSTLKRMLRDDAFPEILELHRADCLASHGNMKLYEFCKSKLAEFEKQGAEEALRPKPLVSGNELIGMGYAPGPLFKEILKTIETEQLEGRIKDTASAVRFIQKQYPAPKQP